MTEQFAPEGLSDPFTPEPEPGLSPRQQARLLLPAAILTRAARNELRWQLAYYIGRDAAMRLPDASPDDVMPAVFELVKQGFLEARQDKQGLAIRAAVTPDANTPRVPGTGTTQNREQRRDVWGAIMRNFGSSNMDHLEAALSEIEVLKGSPVQRVHPGLIMREMVASARDGGRSNE